MLGKRQTKVLKWLFIVLEVQNVCSQTSPMSPMETSQDKE
jgi:hypothetical protein